MTEGFLDRSVASGEGSINGINGYVAATKVNLQVGGLAVIWPGEEWAPPDLFVQDIPSLNKYFSGFQPTIGRRNWSGAQLRSNPTNTSGDGAGDD